MNFDAARRLFLISNSRSYGGGYLEHCAPAIRDFLGRSVRRILFVPHALADRAGYAQTARERFESLGYALDSLDAVEDPRAAVEGAEAVFVGGGNTFRLLSWLYRLDVIEAMRRRADVGMPYLGASAGVNVACPTIRTTNDMPIVESPSLDALGLLPFQINPHFLDADPASHHMGETRETRIAEFHEENTAPVFGMREGCWLRVENGRGRLEGETGAVLFRRGQDRLEIPSPCDLDISSW